MVQPVAFQGERGVSFFEKWEKVFKVDSFTNRGKMIWAEACNLKKECQILLDSFNNLNLHGDDNIQNEHPLTSDKNRMLFNLLHQHCQPPLRLENAEGKHCQLAYCCMAIGRFIDPATGSVSPKTL